MKTRTYWYLSFISLAMTVAMAVATAQQAGRGGPVDPAAAARVKELGSRGVGVHDPSTIVKCNDEYWIFYTGGGVPSWHSKDLITWEAGPRAINSNPAWLTDVVPPGSGRRGRGAGRAASAPATGPTTSAALARGPGRGARGGGGGVANFWAPDVIKVGERYLIYFSYSAFGVNTSAIGLATNPTLDPNDPNYKWTEEGIVVQSRAADDFNTIDPAVTQDLDGKLWLTFGSFWSGIKMIELNPATGKRIAPDSPMYPLAHYRSIEASYIYPHDGKYYLFVNWGLCCRGVNSTYDIRIGRSDKITGPYLDKDGKDLLQGGGTDFLATDGPMIGPGHAGIIADNGKFWFGFHFYDGSRNGASQYAIRQLTWQPDGWPALMK